MINLAEAGTARGWFEPEVLVAQTNPDYPRNLYHVADLPRRGDWESAGVDDSWVQPGETYVLAHGAERYSVLEAHKSRRMTFVATDIIDFDLALEIADALRKEESDAGTA